MIFNNNLQNIQRYHIASTISSTNCNCTIIKYEKIAPTLLFLPFHIRVSKEEGGKVGIFLKYIKKTINRLIVLNMVDWLVT